MDTRKEPGRRSFRRPHFTPRQLLTAEQLNIGLDDELERQRLLNRAVHGYGVIVGLGLTVAADGALDLDRECLELTGGLALDRHGRMLYWRGGRLGLADIVGQPPEREGEYTLCAHFASRPPQDDDCVPYAGERSHWCEEGVAFTLRPGCRDVDRSCAEHPAGACIGHGQYLCRRTGALPDADAEDVPESADLDWILREPGGLVSTGSGDWFYDPDPEVCVPLAGVQVCDLADRAADPHCEPRYGFRSTGHERCSVRPLVYRNPLLYELENGCDVELSRVESISWQDWVAGGWEAEVAWSDFSRRMTTDGLEIWFSRPIERGTLHAGSVFLAALTQVEDSDYWVSRRVPVSLEFLDERQTSASGVRLAPDSDWLAAEVTGRRSGLFGGASFELTIRGQLLRDECGQMLDARPLDIHPRARGQARPGADFVSVFRVGPRHRDQYGPGQRPGYEAAAGGGGGEEEQPAPETPPYVQQDQDR